MPRQKPFNKKTATTYSLVFRPQHDPLINDLDASSQVFTEISGPSKPSDTKNKIKQRYDLEEEFGLSGLVRANEGEAAEHGIYYDDTSYDYMQHMKDLGGASEATWVDASQDQRKGKNKQSLEDALREVDLDDGSSVAASSIAGSSVWGSTYSRPERSAYDKQVDIPDDIAGFQPDMDPRLREVLEALDDEAYVDDEENIFESLTGEGGDELTQEEFEDTLFDDEDDAGWESDDTTKPDQPYNVAAKTLQSISKDAGTDDNKIEPISDQFVPAQSSEAQGDWLAEFTKSKALPTVSKAEHELPLSASKNFPKAAPSSIVTTSTQFGRRKKRKGALTDSSSFSMTSSALARTEPLTTLDARFDKIAESYMEDEDYDDEVFNEAASVATATTNKTNMSKISNWTSGSRLSNAPSLVESTHFMGMMDDFLGSSAGQKGRKMKKGNGEEQWGMQSGMDQLNEIRKGLGPARISSKSKLQKA